MGVLYFIRNCSSTG